MAELDYGGIFLFTTGIVLFFIGLSWGGTVYPWKSAQVLCTLLIGVVILVGLGFYEVYFVKHNALIPPRLFYNVGYVTIVSCATIGAMVYYSLTVLWPTVIGIVYTTDVITIGWQSSVIGGGVLLGQTLSGLSISFVPKVKYQTIIASCLAFAFITSLSSIGMGEAGHTTLLILGILACVSTGFVDNITSPGVTLIIEPQDIGLSSGVLGSIRAAGGAIAQALYVSVLDNNLATALPANVGPAAVNAGLPPSSLPGLFAGITAGNYSTVSGITPNIISVVGEQVTRSYIESFKVVFYVTIPFGIILIAAACFVPNMEGFLGNNVAKRLQSVNKKLGKVEERQMSGDESV